LGDPNGIHPLKNYSAYHQTFIFGTGFSLGLAFRFLMFSIGHFVLLDFVAFHFVTSVLANRLLGRTLPK